MTGIAIEARDNNWSNGKIRSEVSKLLARWQTLTEPTEQPEPSLADVEAEAQRLFEVEHGDDSKMTWKGRTQYWHTAYMRAARKTLTASPDHQRAVATLVADHLQSIADQYPTEVFTDREIARCVEAGIVTDGIAGTAIRERMLAEVRSLRGDAS
jgi:hypothetical protein